jgi:hypothetical protein
MMYEPMPWSEEYQRLSNIRIHAYNAYHSKKTGETTTEKHNAWRHAVRVSESGRTIHERVVGYCHDLIEDKLSSIELIPGLEPIEANAILILTRPEGEHDYQNYVAKIVQGALDDPKGAAALAARVKFYDLCDNLLISMNLQAQNMGAKLVERKM